MLRDASRFDRYVAIERKTTTQDPEMGSPVETWAEQCETYASIRTLGGREAFVVGPNQVTALATHKLTMRWPGFRIRPSDRVVYQGRVFNVDRVNDVGEANRFVELWATEEQS